MLELLVGTIIVSAILFVMIFVRISELKDRIDYMSSDYHDHNDHRKKEIFNFEREISEKILGLKWNVDRDADGKYFSTINPIKVPLFSTIKLILDYFGLEIKEVKMPKPFEPYIIVKKSKNKS